MIGDSLSDIEFGRRLGMLTVFMEGDPERQSRARTKPRNWPIGNSDPSPRPWKRCSRESLARVRESALLPEPFPRPDVRNCPGGQGISELMGEHADLSAMMRIVGDHVGQHGRTRGPRARPAIA